VGRFLSVFHITIPEYHHGIVMEFERFLKVLGPGEHPKNVFTESIEIVPDIFIEEDHFGIKTGGKQFHSILDPGQHFVNTALREQVQIYELSIVPKIIGVF